MAAVVSVQALDLYAFHPANDASSDAYLMVTDLGGEGPEVSLEIRDAFGRLLQSRRKLLAPYGAIRLRIADDVREGAALLHLQSDSAYVRAAYWRVFADGVALSVPMGRPIREDRHVLLHEVHNPDTEAFLLLGSIGGEAECEFTWYSERGTASVERRRLRADALVEIPVKKYLTGTLGTLSINPRKGALWGTYYTRSDRNGIESISLPLPLNRRTMVFVPRVSECEEDYFLIADTSGAGAEVQLTFEETESPDGKQGRLIPHKWLLAPHGTVRVAINDLFGNSREGMMRLHSESAFLAQYALQNQGHISRLSIQEESTDPVGLTWPVWQPSQIVLRFWNAGDEIATPVVLLSRNRLFSQPEREEVFLAPGQLLDWASDVNTDWDSVILRTEMSDTHAFCLGMSGSRLLFVSSLHGRFDE